MHRVGLRTYSLNIIQLTLFQPLTLIFSELQFENIKNSGRIKQLLDDLHFKHITEGFNFEDSNIQRAQALLQFVLLRVS